MVITIGKPYKEVQENGNIRMISYISGEKEKPYPIWYEVSPNLGQYLAVERADAFVVGLLPHFMAITSNKNPIIIKSEQCLSEQLFYQLTQYYIPTLSKFTKMYHKVKLQAKYETKILESAGAVGTGISGGVDSFYSLLNHAGSNINRNVTHGLYCNTGMFGGFDGSGEMKLLQHAQKICHEVDITNVVISSNICKDLYQVMHAAIISPMFMSFVLALQKLFKVYYHSSETPFSMFSLYAHNSERYDLFNVHCFSTANTQFYSSGSEVNRIDKIKYISRFPVVKDKLIVCPGYSMNQEVKGLKNCSRCSKCTYTMVQMDILGILDDFAEVFDVKAFRKDPDYYYGYFVYKSKKDSFKKETLTMLHKTGKRLSIGSRIRGIGKIIKNGFRRENPLAEGYRP